MAGFSGDSETFKVDDSKDTYLGYDDTTPAADLRHPFDPRPRFSDQLAMEGSSKDTDYEELYEAVPHDITGVEIALLTTRCVVVFVCLVGVLAILIGVARGSRIKSWRLYILTALTIFAWLAMTLYQDHIDEYFVQEVNRFPQRRSIYWCFRNLVHGLSLFLVVLLLGHLSDFHHRGSWLFLIATVVVVPLVYSITLLIIDLRLQPEIRLTWEFNIGVATFRVFLYNFITTFIILAFASKLCTRRQYGTYSEHRSPLAVLISRWTYAFLLLHNLTAMASYGAAVASRVPHFENSSKATLAHEILDEILLAFIVLAVPISYLAAMAGKACCGMDYETDNVEMDKIYQQVWKSNTAQPIQTQPLNQNQQQLQTPLQPITLNASHLQGPSSVTSGEAKKNGGQASHRDSTTSSLDTIGELPNFKNRPQKRPKSNSKDRESYLEAVSTGSLEGSSVKTTSSPVEL